MFRIMVFKTTILLPWACTLENRYTQQGSEVDKLLNLQDAGILKYCSSSQYKMKQKRGGLIYKVFGMN